MKWILCRSCILTAAALVLPGCLAINAVLGVMGYIAAGPGQLIGTAYTVSEYTYEYAVNDKTPDEVIQDKFEWLIQSEEDPQITGYAKAFRKSVLAPPMADVDPEVRLADSSLGASGTVSLTPVKQAPAPAMKASLAPRKSKAADARPAKARPRPPVTNKTESVVAPPAVPARIAPTHQYIERETDPLLARMDRLEQAFRQAESMAHGVRDSGLLLSVQSDDSTPADQGVSGSWSIRHGVMEHGPSPPVTHADTPALPGQTVS